MLLLRGQQQLTRSAICPALPSEAIEERQCKEAAVSEMSKQVLKCWRVGSGCHGRRLAAIADPCLPCPCRAPVSLVLRCHSLAPQRAKQKTPATLKQQKQACLTRCCSRNVSTATSILIHVSFRRGIKIRLCRSCSTSAALLSCSLGPSQRSALVPRTNAPLQF